MIYESAWWSLETAGWTVDESDESTALVPCDTEQEAALVISAFRKADGLIAPEELWEMAGAGSPASAERSSVRCGEFGGYQTQFEDDGLHWRVWWLASGAVHIYASFNCQPKDAGRHDAVLDWMLSSLRILPNAG